MSKYFLLLLIILAALFLRFWGLSSNPPSLTWDEVAWGYNAYSLGVDGRDEFGKFLPITHLESFGDTKPPLYAYLTILPVKVFGLNEFSTRFASAFFGVLTVLLTFFLTREIFIRSADKDKIAIFAASIMAISPWHILLSRAAFEANVATFFIVSGVLLFFVSVRKKSYLLILSIVFFVLSTYTFNSARIVSPIITAILFIFFYKDLIKFWKKVIVACVLGFVIFFPLGLFLLTPEASLRYHEVNIFSDVGIVKKVNQQIENDNQAFWSKLMHNRRFAYGISYIKHYLDNLSPSFLFIKGDGNPKFSIQDVGQMYFWEMPFFIAGIFLLLHKREGNWWVVPIWLLIAIIPAGVARETPHALRTEGALPTFQILSAYGAFYFLKKISNIKYQILRIHARYLLFSGIFLIILFNLIYFLHNYFNHYPREFSGEWQYGYKSAIEYVKTEQNKYDVVYSTIVLGRPYIYFLYYMSFDPSSFRKSADVKREALGFVHVNSFGKFHFAKDLPVLPKSAHALYINSPEKLPTRAQKLKEFKLLNGQVILIAYTL